MEPNDTAQGAPAPDPKPAPDPPEAPRISIGRFMETELRVAQIMEAERVPGTDKLMKLQLDVGSERRQIVAGIKGHYEPGDLVGKQIYRQIVRC